MSSPGKDPGIIASSDVQPGTPVTIRRRSSGASETNRPRHSPTIPRSFDPNDPQARERQRTMDVDIAMHLSRARRETILSSPTTSPFENNQPPVTDVLPISALSEHEERQIDFARGRVLHDEPEGITVTAPTALTSETSLIDLNGHLHQTQDPDLLVSPQIRHLEPHHDSESVYGLPTYQDNVSRTNFDFTPMEQFATIEKAALGLTSAPSTKFSLNVLRQTRSRGPQASTSSAAALSGEGSIPADATPTPTTFPHRKLSESNTNPRLHHRKGIGGKMALFEGSPNDPSSPPSLPSRLQQPPTHSHDNFLTPSASLYQTAPPPPGILHTGHDRPYRFSFYSNTLAATIHARSLSELPADGQSFEDLFSGILPGHGPVPGEKQGTTRPLSSPAYNSRPGTALGSNKGTATMNNSLDSSYFNHGSGTSGTRKSESKSALVGGGGGANGKYETDGDSDAKTWWLDVQSPTDEEMKMLSKVFSIHPLTTEDIQMEETREKIELFRNYYLVCFRSFDQDQYSPTYLEPLNMYIIVFREGILSFHFRPTPHPQNVRRRIKQLKDYINVTSDWISYALIDDITDAFGPLIQSIEYEVDSIDDLVLILKEAEQSDMLRRIGTCRKKVMGLLRLMGNKADVVKGLAKRCNENWRVAPTSDIGLYLSDIQDHLITMTQNLNHYEKILSRSHSNYLAQISIEMTEANNQINDVLSKLTALGTILIPMNLITGLWGMNVHVPGQDVPGYAWFVSIIAGLVAFACIGGYSTYRFLVRGT